MNTATITRRNVANATPIITIIRDAGRLAVFATADDFVENNIRHVVNRRMKWNDFAEPFVRVAVEELAKQISGDSQLRSTEVLNCIEDVIDLVRDAANRRKAWNSVEQFILMATERLIRAAS